jgi:hypothetical protein
MLLVVWRDHRKSKRMKSFKRIEKIVQAEPSIEYYFLMENERHTINGARRAGYRAGFKINDGSGLLIWISAEEFERDYVAIEE